MMELIILVISSILIFSGVPSNAEELRFQSSETDSKEFDDPEDSVSRAWSAFKTQYEKSYSSSEEDQRRRLIFEESLKIVQSHNYLYETGRSSYEMGINQFSDMEFSEILEMTGYVEGNANFTGTEEDFSSLPDDRIPSSIDWRQRGCVTPVKNQGHCGSCWAFSATGALECQWKRKTGRLVSFSEQNLVDCSRAQGNKGCKGGWMQWAFQYIKKNRGIDTEACYPYEAKEGRCRYRASCRGATVRGYRVITGGNEKLLKNAIAKIGPIAVAIDVRPSFSRYKRGIYEDSSCTKTRLNHAVLAVGYGTTGGKCYYIVKNSWGASWGDKGYILMARNKGNMCGIASVAVVPLV